MARSLPSAYHAAREMLGGHELVFLELLRVELLDGVFAYLANNENHVEAGGHTFQAASFRVEGVEESAGAGLSSVRVTVSNVSRRPAAWLESDGILGLDLTLWLVLASELPDLPDALSYRYTAVRASFDDASCTIDAGPPATLLRLPTRTITTAEFPGVQRRALR